MKKRNFLASTETPVEHVHLKYQLHSNVKTVKEQTLLMRSSLVIRVSDCQCSSCNGPGFDPSIRRHSGIWGAADEAVLNIVEKKEKNPPKKIFKKKEQTFHKRSTNVPISNRNETKTFEFVRKFGPGEQILDQIETICFQ
jgi:hypothetical protein